MINVPLQIVNWGKSDGTPPSARESKMSNPICAREAKGFNNWGQTGVLVIKKCVLGSILYG